MKIKLKDLIVSSNAIQKLAATPLNVKIAFRLKRILKQVTSELETFESARKELCEKYGTLEGDRYEFEPDEKLKFEEEFNQLMEEEVEIKFDRFSEDSLASVEFAASDLLALEWLFIEDEKEESKEE